MLFLPSFYANFHFATLSKFYSCANRVSMWLTATILYNTDAGHFCHLSKFCGTVLFSGELIWLAWLITLTGVIQNASTISVHLRGHRSAYGWATVGSGVGHPGRWQALAMTLQDGAWRLGQLLRQTEAYSWGLDWEK